MQSQAEEPTKTPVGVADDEPVASTTRSQTATDEPIAARTRQALESDPEKSAFADVKDEKTLNEWLHEISLVTSTMSDPDEPQSFQEAWWDHDLIAREKWQEDFHLEFKKLLDMGVWRHVKRRDCPNDHRLVGCRWVFDRIPSTTPGADPPRDVKDSGSARSHSTHLETSSSNRP